MDDSNKRMSDAEWLGVKEEPIAQPQSVQDADTQPAGGVQGVNTTVNTPATSNIPVAIDNSKYEKMATWAIILNFGAPVIAGFWFLSLLAELGCALSSGCSSLHSSAYYYILMLVVGAAFLVGIILSFMSFGKTRSTIKKVLIVVSLLPYIPVVLSLLTSLVGAL